MEYRLVEICTADVCVFMCTDTINFFWIWQSFPRVLYMHLLLHIHTYAAYKPNNVLLKITRFCLDLFCGVHTYIWCDHALPLFPVQ